MRDVIAFTVLGTLLFLQYFLMWMQDKKKGYKVCSLVAQAQTFALLFLYLKIIDLLMDTRQWPHVKSTSGLFILNMWTYRWIGLDKLPQDNRILDRYFFYELAVGAVFLLAVWRSF